MQQCLDDILKCVHFTKTQKSRYLKNKTFFLQIKKLIKHQGLFYCKNSFVAEVTFNIARFSKLFKFYFST